MLESPPVRVLSVGPGEAAAEAYATRLDGSGVSVEPCSNPGDVVDRLAGEIEAVVSTYRLDGTDGLAILREVREAHPEVPFVLLAEDGNERVASEAIAAGVTDYVPIGDDEDFADRVREAVRSGPGDDAGDRDPAFQAALLEAQAEATIDGFLVVDENREIRYHNRRFAEIWDIPEEVLAEGSDEKALEHVYDRLERPEEFLEKVEYLYDNPLEESRDEIELVDDRWLDRYSAPVLGEDGTQYGRLWVFRDVTQRKRRERALREAYETVAAPDLSFRERVDDLLAIGRRALGCDRATFARVRDGEYDVVSTASSGELEPGDGDARLLSLSEWERVAASERGIVAENLDAPSVTSDASGCLGTPVSVDGEVYGTVRFSDVETRAEEFSEWQVTFVELLGNWLETERERERRTERLAALDELNGVVRDINRELAERTTREEIERVVCERLAESDSYAFAWIGTVADDSADVEVSTAANARGYLDGLDVTVDDTETGNGPTGRALRTGELQVVQDVEEAAEYGPWRERAIERGVGSSAAIPIAHEGSSYGVLNVYTERTNAFDGEEQAVVGQLGEITGLAIAAVERERRIEAIFEQTYQFTGLTEPDGTLIEANETALAFGDLDREDVIGEALWETYWFQATEETRERTREAVERASQGEFVRHELAVQGGDREAVIDFSIRPVTDEQGEVDMLIPEGRDITERVERERQLARERERLEFVNRLIRHNLLNSLNVVAARADIVEGYVDPEARDHVETIRERTADMIDLIETLRAMIRAAVEEERDLEPVDLGAVLHEEVENARDAFENATFEARFDDPGVVLADGLLGEVFENLLSNAVQHNDSPEPRVAIEVERDDETITVRVADNGPGVPEEIRERIFEKGEKGFESPGTGFGLHLAREIVEGYDGSIDVAENDPRGSVFSIVLPRTP